jgi:hypothetical protein
MGASVRRKVTLAVGATGILVLALGGIGVLRTVANAERIDDRNLRELARIARSVEGTVNNLDPVMRSLAGEDEPGTVMRNAGLIPHLTVIAVDTLGGTRPPWCGPEDGALAEQTRLEVDLVEGSLNLCYHRTPQDTLPIYAEYGRGAIHETLTSDYFDVVFLAHASGPVFLWGPDRPVVRVRDLMAVDTLQGGSARPVEASTILQVPIAGRDYRFYLLPLRIGLAGAPDGTTHNDWVAGGLVRASSVRQESLSLGPAGALLLGFLAVVGFLIAPFVRVFTMGPRERLSVGSLLYVVLSLILASGLAGLGLADLAQFRQLRAELYDDLEAIAATVAQNVEREVEQALQELDLLGDSLRRALTDGADGSVIRPWEPEAPNLESVLMRTRIAAPEDRPFYPNLHMAFWTDPAGEQVAKWTPRAENTPRVRVHERGYFRAIREGRGWPRMTHAGVIETCGSNGAVRAVAGPGAGSMYLESIRSWTTGEKLAAIAMPFPWVDSPEEADEGIAVVVTRLASLDRPVLPPGFEVAVVDAGARTLFHSRAERILEEDFAEETDNAELVRSILDARACRALDLRYGGRRTRLAIRPLPGKPLFLVVMMDRAQLDTVRFEAWYTATALFGTLVLFMIGFVVLLNWYAGTRIGWAWPDRDRPGKYPMLIVIGALFLLVSAVQALWPDRFPLHPGIFLIPFQFLGLGLVILARRSGAGARSREADFGWAVFVIGGILLGLAVWGRPGEPIPWLHLLVTALAPTLVLAWRRVPELNHFLEEAASAVPARYLYAAAMACGVMVIAMLPGYLSYQGAFLTHSELLVKYHQLGIDQARDLRTARLDSIARVDSLRGSYRDALHAQDFDRAFEGMVFDTREADPAEVEGLPRADPGRRHAVFGRVLGDRVPFLSEASVGMRQLSAVQSDREWRRAEDAHRPFDRIWLTADPPLISGFPPRAGRVDGGWLLALLAALTGLGLTVYWVTRRVFFIHVEHPEPLGLEDALPAPGEEWTSRILIGTRSISRAPLLARSDEIHFVDMMAGPSGAGSSPNGPPGPGGEGLGGTRSARRVVCLDNFDHRFTEAAWNLDLLERMERLAYAEDRTPVVVLTSRDPEAALRSPASELGLSGADRLRWVRVLGRFTKVMLADFISTAPFRACMAMRVTGRLLGELEASMPELKRTVATAPPADGRDRLPVAAARMGRAGVLDAAVARLDWLTDELDDLRRMTDPTGASRNGERPAPMTPQLIRGLEDARVRLERFAGEGIGGLEERADEARGIIEAILTPGSPVPAGRLSRRAGTPAGARVPRRLARERRKVDRVRQTLLSECGRSQRLQEIGGQILARPDWTELTHGELLDLIREGADSYYSALWAILSEEERLVAAQLAAGAVVNPRSHQAVTRLFARGLVERKPDLRLKNESFTRFIRETVPRDVLARWEHADAPSTWEMIRGPLLLGWIGVALFLFWAQRDLLGNAIAFLSTAGVGLAALLKVMTVFERSGGGGSASSG